MEDGVDQHVARWATFWKDEPKFAPEVEGALVRMKHILRWIERDDAAAFARIEEDFTLQDFKTLHVLMIQPWPTEATPAQLAEAANVTRAAMTSRLDRLESAGLVTRTIDAQDRRRVLIRPTAAGRDKWNSYIFQGMARDQAALKALSYDEVVQLNGLLRKVLHSLGE
ncbi:MarR family transcriptional regulator [Actinoplanes cyaneus]|uniref:MarR family transcriptional regulator n=1 Tax=Actinoplanes cyaneus TaxID=52696 RepID=A0A919IGV5_9ACTN|nr:MarR family transcriptional regulator [Actinoplanes cyaneus]MCW2137172.1 DNA-binding transcriptional regulator, MarR family [Actinoplanes cyaneus]GID63223.1 MarR family transcriptional regulator [Actinoplanes cyaneus]